MSTHTPTLPETHHDYHIDGAPAKRIDADNYPPHSRLFVLCDKSSTEDDLRNHFAPFGTVQYCKIIRDKQTQDSKGYCYVKFDKASAAADALEKAEGTVVAKSGFPIKIEIAQAKGSRSATPAKFTDEPEDTPPRSRLFVVCPKEMNEHQITECFSQFPDFEYGKVIMDKSTGLSKGFAYVKFHKASSAAMALETVNEKGTVEGMRVKVLIADPKAKRRDVSESWSFTSQWDTPHSTFVPTAWNMPTPFHPLDLPTLPVGTVGMSPYMMPYMIPPVTPVHFVVECSSSLIQEDLHALFSPYDGFEACHFSRVPYPDGSFQGIAHVYFTDPQRAMVAVEKVNGIQLGDAPLRCSWDNVYRWCEHPTFHLPTPSPYWWPQY